MASVLVCANQEHVRSPLLRTRSSLPCSEQDILKSLPATDYGLIRAYLLPLGFFQKVPPRAPVSAAARRYAAGRRLASSKKGAMALMPPETRIGDSIALLHIASYPFVVREEDEDEQEFTLVGEALMIMGTFGSGAFEKDGYVRSI